MTIEDVKAIIQGDETRTLEMKKTTGELKDGMRSACAFLNTAGGWLFFGIAPIDCMTLHEIYIRVSLNVMILYELILKKT